MKKFIVTAIAIGILMVAGCTEEDYQMVDDIAGPAQKISENVGTVTPFLPPDISLYLSLGGALIGGLAAGWQKWRRNQAEEDFKELAKENTATIQTHTQNPQEAAEKQRVSMSVRTTERMEKANASC